VFASTCSSCCGITITLPEAPWPPANLQYKPLGEPAIDLRQHLLGVFLLALFLGISSHDGWTRIKGNTLKRNQFIGIETVAADGAADFSTGTSVNDVLDVRIERNTVKSQTGGGVLVAGGVGSADGRAGAGVFGPLAEDGGRGVKP
jgi:hypothetical protein